MVPGDLLINERVDHETGEKPQIEDVASQGEEASVSKEKGLDDQDRRKSKKTCVRTKQDSEDQPSAQVTAGPGSWNGKVDHLGSKYKGSQDSHQWNLAIIHPVSEFTGGVSNESRCGRPGSAANSGGYQGVRHVH